MGFCLFVILLVYELRLNVSSHHTCIKNVWYFTQWDLGVLPRALLLHRPVKVVCNLYANSLSNHI